MAGSYNPSAYGGQAVPGQDPQAGFNPGAYAQGNQARQNADQAGRIQGGLMGQGFGYNQALQGQQEASAERMNQANINAQLAGYGSQQKIAGIQANAAMYAPGLQQKRFNQVFPVLSGALKAGSSGLNSPADFTGQPKISANPVFSDNQIQQQVNQQTAANDQGTATKMRQSASQMGGRGVGSQSPLSQALNMGYQNQNMATNTQNAASTRLNSAQANASQVLAGQSAQENQFANRQKEAIGRSQVYQGYLSSALGALSGLV